ncbi:MAG: hypothetical protein FJ405_02835 [Verrucomicrobia bacterium]|nr:hypothetical protein [Verrucomicrobiota bacterium]
MDTNRRRFFKRASFVAAATAAAPFVARSSGSDKAEAGQKPSRIIHIVSDGMSAGTLSCADQLSLITRGRGLTWMALCRREDARMGWMETRSLNSLVTDSAAAASSWGSGVRVNNGVINQTSKGVALKTLYELFGQAGWKRGLVTTAELTHATPAGFATAVSKRGMGTAIAKQYLERRIEVLLGGGGRHFEKDYRLDKRDLLAEFGSAGYRVMRTQSELSVASTGMPWLGVFTPGHLPYALDHVADAKLRADVPTLASMTAAALRRLGGEERFILQVEGARIDHACHNNDAAAALQDQIALDEAIDVCIQYQQQYPETLVVMTTDHGNANLGLNGVGDSYSDSTKALKRVADVKSSFAALYKPLKRRPAVDAPEVEKDDEEEKKKEAAKSNEQKDREAIQRKKDEENVATPTEIIELVRAATGYRMPYRKAEVLRMHFSNAGESLHDMRKADVCALGDVMANHLGIGFVGTVHTSDHVPVLALGPGAGKFAGFLKNTDIFHAYTSLAGIDFRNPEEPLVAAGPEAHQVERISEYLLA